MSVKILEGIEDSMRFNDKYFPRVDIKDPRYKRYKYKGKLFVYDTKDCLVILLFQDDEEVENLGKDKAPWREMESAGLRYENWKNKEIRNEYLDEWIWEMDDEADRLADDFIKYELPYIKESTEDNDENFCVVAYSTKFKDFQVSTPDTKEHTEQERDDMRNDPEYRGYTMIVLRKSYVPKFLSGRGFDISQLNLDESCEESVEDDTYGTQMDVVLHLPYYDDDEDMKYFTIHVDANSEDEAIEKAKKYIKAKKTSKNAKIWKDAEVHEVKTY